MKNENKKNLCIWMDHSVAHLIEDNPKEDTRSIESEFSFETHDETLRRNEDLMYHKEQLMHKCFYKNIGDEILKYDYVFLFGPNGAKKEFQNYIKSDLHFKEIKIEIESSDKISTNEQEHFVINHFESLI